MKNFVDLVDHVTWISSPASLEAKGMWVGPLMDDLPSSPWHHRLTLRERMAPEVMNSWMVLGQIDYGDDVVKFVDV